jgi:hypothetical protein
VQAPLEPVGGEPKTATKGCLKTWVKTFSFGAFFGHAAIAQSADLLITRILIFRLGHPTLWPMTNADASSDASTST